MKNILLLLLFVPFFASCEDAKKNTTKKKDQVKLVLNSVFAGSWYPKDKDKLKKELNGYLENVKEKKVKDVIAVILPHAGYRFSGQVAMYGIAEIKDRTFDKVIIIGLSHRLYLKNKVSIPDVTHYGTPLGEVRLDRKSIDVLRKSQYVTDVGRKHYFEHSVQIEVPLIQFGLKDPMIIPVVCGDLDQESSKNVAETLLQVVTPKTLVVVSSDFVHYGKNFNYIPFEENIEDNIRKVDMGAYDQISRLSPKGFRNYIDKTEATICGRNSIGVLLDMLPKESKATLLKYDTSGRMMSDFTSSVSYMSIAFSGKWKEGKKMNNKLQKAPSGLNEEEKKTLLLLARKTISHFLKNPDIPSPEDLNIEITDAMKKKMGAFVTLHKDGQLRGCIGEILPSRPLCEAVLNRAVSSAFSDRRFRPLKKDELDEIDIEISALTPPKEIGSWKDIVIGKHGIIIEKNGRTAVFLPQVAPEQGWDVETTLTYLSRKAGLKPDDWKKGAKFFVFEADVFGEKEKE